MAKLRKMLGDVNAPVTVALMQLIETQSGTTLAGWALSFVEENVLPIYAKAYPDDITVRQAIDAAKGYVAGEVTLKDVKAQIKIVNQIARDTADTPVAQAAVRAIATACAVTYSPTGALGYTFYAAAAIVYDKVGVQEKPAVYDELAAKEFDNLLASLQAVAVADEPNPVKVNWNC